LTDLPVKEKYVLEVFNSIAPKYELINLLMSFGIHRYWQRVAMNMANIHADDKVLDVCCGTGFLTRGLAQRVGPYGAVTGLDFSNAMLNIAESSLKHFKMKSNLNFIQANASKMPFPDNTFDCVTIGYGLRNTADPKRVLTEIQRVTKIGGRVLSLEMVKPNLPIFKEIYACYLKSWVPFLGHLLAHNKGAYQYFQHSILTFIDKNQLSALYQQLGFVNIHYKELSLGIAVIHTGIKPYQ
jgi:ubiquinone/menaquinone biosynthesis methyltransferases